MTYYGETDFWDSLDITKARRFNEIGLSGLKVSGGLIIEEFLTALRGEKYIKVYKEMHDNDPIVGAVILVIKNLIRQAEWFIEPASDSNVDKEIADFVTSCMEDMEQSWKQFISEVLSMVIYGWSYFEIVYKRRKKNLFDPIFGSKFDDRRIGWRNLAVRSQDSFWRWELDDNDRLVGLTQQAFNDMKERTIPLSKSLHFRTTTHKNNPQGESILRKAYRPWFFKKRIEEIEGIGIERDLAGLPVAWVPPELLKSDATAEQKATLAAIEELVKNVRNDEQAGLVLPLVYDERGNKLFEFELMSSKGRRNFDTDKIIMRYNRTIAMSALADFIILGHDNVGSFALASSKTKVFSVAVGSYMDEISEVFNRRAIPQLLEINGIRPDALPKLAHSDIETIDLDDLAKYVMALGGQQGIGMDLSGQQIGRFLLSQANMPHEEVNPELRPPHELFAQQLDSDNGDDDGNDD